MLDELPMLPLAELPVVAPLDEPVPVLPVVAELLRVVEPLRLVAPLFMLLVLPVVAASLVPELPLMAPVPPAVDELVDPEVLPLLLPVLPLFIEPVFPVLPVAPVEVEPWPLVALPFVAEVEPELEVCAFATAVAAQRAIAEAMVRVR